MSAGIAHGFDLASWQRAAARGALHAWVIEYLTQPGWANPGLNAGLQRDARTWSGPICVALADLDRVCGPEPGMIYRIPSDQWAERIDRYAQKFRRIEDLPPLILERRAARFLINDGSHRHALLAKLGFAYGWAVIWDKA